MFHRLIKYVLRIALRIIFEEDDNESDRFYHSGVDKPPQ